MAAVPADDAASAATISNPAADTSSIDDITDLVAGNDYFTQHPETITGLLAAKATKQQAQAINMFGLAQRAGAQAVLAQRANVQIALSGQQQQAAGAAGVNLGNSVSNQKPAAAKPSGGWGIGRVWHDVLHNPVTNSIGKAGNQAMASAGLLAQGVADVFTGIGSTHFSAKYGITNDKIAALIEHSDKQVKAAGYDPSNPLSVYAYQASGNATLDLSDMYQQHDPALVDQAIQAADNPHGVQGLADAIFANPDLTDSQKVQQVQALNDPKFKTMVFTVLGRRSSPGNLATEGIDMEKHPVAKMLTAGAIDTAVAFAIDPTNVGLAGYKVFTMSKVALDAAGDTEKIYAVYSGAQKGIKATQSRRGIQTVIDNTKAIREAKDEQSIAVAYSNLRNLTPQLQHLAEDFMNQKEITVLHHSGEVVVKAGEPITSMEAAAQYLSSNVGMARLLVGKAPAEIGYMPGQLSRFGAKTVRASLAAKMTARGVKKINSAAIDLDKAGMAARILARPGDAADVATGKVVDSFDDGTDAESAAILASKARATALGKATFESRKGLGPSALYNRSKLFAQRIGSFMPKDTTFDVEDPNLAEKVFQYSNGYLTRSHANLMAAKIIGGNEADKKAILSGLALQVAHAAGLGTTDGGRQMLEDMERAFTRENYSTTAPKLMDPNTLEERDFALFPSDTSQVLSMPSFQEIQKNAAKIGIWESTIGRAFTHQLADETGKLIKVGWLSTFSNVIRNAGEDLFGAFVDGKYGQTRMAKHALALGGNLPKRLSGRIAAKTPGVRRVQVSLARVGRLWHQANINADDPRTGAEFLMRDNFKEVLKNIYDNYIAWHVGSNVDPNGIQMTSDITAAGLLPKRFRIKRAGFGTYDTEGEIGATRLSQSLARIFNGNRELAQTILDHLAPRSESVTRSEVVPHAAPVAKALDERVRDAYYELATPTADDPEPMVSLARLRRALPDVPRDELDGALKRIAREEGNLIPEANQKMLTQEERDAAIQHGGQEKHLVTMRHRPPTEPAVADSIGDEALPVTEDDVIAALLADPKTKRMVRANVFRDADGVDRKAVTDAEKAMAIRQLAQHQIHEIGTLIANPDGRVNAKLLEKLRSGDAPSADWIMNNLTDADRPVSVLAPHYEPVPPEEGVTGLVAKLADIAGEGYKQLVENAIARVSSLPIFTANYAKSRVLLRSWEQRAIEGGLTPEAADREAMNIAMQMAWQRTANKIDDPTLRTHMDIVGRNFFAFSRATTAFIRRWGLRTVQDPAAMRRAFMVMEAGQRTGIFYTDANGQKQFTFPGSGMAINALLKAGHAMHLPGFVNVPGVVPNLGGKVAFLSPGLSNPLQMSFTPMVNIPARLLEKLHPQSQQTFDQIDAFFNGSQGPGQQHWYSELLPTAVKKFTDALSTDDKDSLNADATRAAILSLEAAGHGPPQDADPAKMAAWLQNVQTTIKNQLLVRAMFGFFSPAPPGIPTEENDATQADWMYRLNGIHGLDDEYKQIINDTGSPAEAAVLWAGLHPDKLIFTVPTTTNSTKSAVFSATKASQDWINHNLGFMKDFKGVAAYFIPQATQDGKFDLGAYNAELELGLRQHKSTAEFLTDVMNADSANEYYKNLDAKNAYIAKDPANATAIRSAWSDWQAQFMAAHPVFAQNQTDYSQAAATAQGQLQTLRRMVQANGLPASVPVAEVKQMLAAYDAYHGANKTMPGETNEATAYRASNAGAYNIWMHNMVAEHPELAGLFTGVFRTLDSQTLDPLGS
ncbi:MAG TPA: hypothetical protein VFE75_05490 [Rhodanobacter sp.]|nr:hypothetical protein [Rhodanobacter sp.]